MTLRALLLPVLLSVCLLTGCTVLPERSATILYTLPPATGMTTNATAALDSLRLATPSAPEALGGTRLLVQRDNGFEAHAGARWAASVPVLWRDWLLDAFWKDGRVAALSTSSDGLQATLELGGVLRAFHHEIQGEFSRAVIHFDARLIETASRRILASQRFEVEERVQGREAAQVVDALGRAAQQLSGEVIAWTLEQGSAPRSR